MTQDQFLRVLKAECKPSAKALAARWRISASYLSDVLRQRRDPGKSILDQMGYERRVTYHKVSDER